MHTSYSGRTLHASSKPKNSGFTIVELLVVIVVIGILATISVAVYSGIQKRAAEALMTSELAQVERQIEADRVTQGAYGESHPDGSSSVYASDRSVVHNYYQRDAGDDFCADVYSVNYDDLSFHVVGSGGAIQSGLCPENNYSPDGSGGGEVATAESCFMTSDVAGGVEITDYLGGEQSVHVSASLLPECPFDAVIPSEIDGQPVVSIAGSSFGYRELTSVDIPDSVVTIGVYAFRNNDLTSVTIPDGVTNIGRSAFNSNNLTSVTIPDSVTNIGRWAFGHNNLTSVTIPDSVTNIGSSAFRYNNLTSVTIPDSVTNIGRWAFGHNNLTSVTIPDSVTSIGNGTFAYNDLTSVTIPDGVTNIGDIAFRYNDLTSVTIPDSVTDIGSNAFRNNDLTTVEIGAHTTIHDDGAFDSGVTIVRRP